MSRGRRVLLLSLVLVVLLGGAGVAQATINSSEPTPLLMVSSSESRTDPVALPGAAISGQAYIFLAADHSVRRVAFYLDRSTTDPASNIETIAPFDLAGTDQDTGKARPISTL